MNAEEQEPKTEEQANSAELETESEQEVLEGEVEAAEPVSEDIAADEKDWSAEVAKLNEQVETFKDQAVRAQAEMQNIRRRSEMDVEKAHKFALEKFAKELLPIIDSLEKAIETDKEQNAEAGVLREGVEMTLSMFMSGVKKFNLEPVDPTGQPFDPALHEAMSMVPSPDAEPNSVIAVMQKGYTLSGRLIRPAMVMVAK